jgi:hypothetical protein
LGKSSVDVRKLLAPKLSRAKLNFMGNKIADASTKPAPAAESAAQPKPDPSKAVEEVGGPKGPDPTRFGDWSVNGRCIDF